MVKVHSFTNVYCLPAHDISGDATVDKHTPCPGGSSILRSDSGEKATWVQIRVPCWGKAFHVSDPGSFSSNEEIYELAIT